MSDFQVSRYQVKRTKNELGNYLRENFSSCSRIRFRANRWWPGFAVDGSHFSLQRRGNLVVTIILYSSTVAVSGCVTCADLESLRSEVAKANAVAARAEAGLSTTQRQLTEMIDATESSQSFSRPGGQSTASLPNESGYKWGKRRRD